MPETIAIASDHAGVTLKETLKDQLLALGFLPEDMGAFAKDSVDYPDYAHLVSKWIVAQPARRGVLICGSGIGMSIAANRHKGVRAALCRTVEDAGLARTHNNANVLCLGERSTDAETAKEILKHFLATPFDGGRHETRVNKMDK
ncbi:MAG: ribose 5-phosphate isomerase B [Alphaproteobacteria bacterium]|nr:ribose 5-phosphate isomerase B [Alphaproteobacteria bacterium]